MTDCKRIVIVGGVAGGASAAARARRVAEDADIVLIERGETISFANCGMPYHIGEVIADRKSLLVQTAESMRKRYNIDVRTRHEAVRIDRPAKQLIVRNLRNGAETAETYDTLILSPGAEPFRPKMSGLDSPCVKVLRTLADMDGIKSAIDRDKPAQAVIVGGGYIGLEMAEALRARGVGVTLVELADQVFLAADAEMVFPIQQQLKLHGVELMLGCSVTAIEEQPSGSTASSSPGAVSVRLSTGPQVSCGLVILAVGVRPESGLARQAGLEIGSTGGIVVDDHMRTSDPSIFAVGDAVEVTHLVGGYKALIPLAGPANRQGRIAADNALGRDSVYRGTQGTAICKVFDLAIGMTGLSEKELKRQHRRYEKVYVHPASHASYYPGASQLTLKLLFDPQDGTILGSQAVGADGVDKRIDVLAVAMRAGLKVAQLRELELSYAPPYGSAKDPVNYAGFVASNVMQGDMALCHVEDVANPSANQILLDVRTAAEVQAGTIGAAINIPVDDIRGRIAELPRDKEILVFCQVGLRGYVACRILRHYGLACRNLTGGYKTFMAVRGMMAAGSGTGASPNANQARKEMKNDAASPADPVVAATAGDAALPAGGSVKVAAEIDARCLQCPGPIMKLKEAIDSVQPGRAVGIVAGDPAFPVDVAAWCQSTGNELVSVVAKDGAYRATVIRGQQVQPAARAPAEPDSKKKTIVVFSGDFDKAMAAFIIANGAASMGSDVTMFFTFWGLNVLRKGQKVAVQKSIIERMFGWMMPRGAGKLKLSNMNMGGMGLAMIKGIMRKKHVASLEELIDSARKAGVRLVACQMSMDLMGIAHEELIDGVQQGGVAMYLNQAEGANVNLFI